MFPQNVGRLVLDGVEDAVDTYAGEFLTNLKWAAALFMSA
jgi:hypothetical protein